MANAHDVHHEGSHGSVKSYMIGFVLSIILTAIPFGLVMYPSLPKNLTVLIVVAMAVIQVVVHLVYFLHMDRSKSNAPMCRRSCSPSWLSLCWSACRCGSCSASTSK